MNTIAIPTHRKILYLGFVVLVLLAFFEAGIRLRAWSKYGSASASVRDPMLVRDDAAGLWVPRPGYEIKGANIHIKINSLGFRGEEFSKAKPPGTFRIVVLGASTTFSSEASSNAAIWTARLQEKLRSATGRGFDRGDQRRRWRLCRRGQSQESSQPGVAARARPRHLLRGE